MINRSFILENSAEFLNAMKLRKHTLDIQQLVALLSQETKLISQLQQAYRARKLIANTSQNRTEGKEIADQIINLKIELDNCSKILHPLLASIPAIPDISVQPEELLIKTWGEKQKIQSLCHTTYSKLDFASASVISGSKFVYLIKEVATLHRALIQYMLDQHIAQGYMELYVPYLVQQESVYRSGQLPNLEHAMYKTDDNHYLIPTGEASLVNILPFLKQPLPIKLVTSSPCFRKEIGAYGALHKGLIRQHQFEKVELVQCVPHADQGDKALMDMVNAGCNILEKLQLPYRILQLRGDDMGFAATKTLDIEVWMPGQNRYVEISSCSLCGDFQSRRMKFKYEGAYPITLNASGLAIGRTLAALIENHTDDKGILHLPLALQSYLPFSTLDLNNL